MEKCLHKTHIMTDTEESNCINERSSLSFLYRGKDTRGTTQEDNQTVNGSEKENSEYFNMRGSHGKITKMENEQEIQISPVQVSGDLNNLRNTISFSSKKPINSKFSKRKEPILLVTEKYKYTGECDLDNKREGLGICIYKNGDRYTGYFRNDKKEGWGKFYQHSTQKIFNGEFKNNTLDGFVEYINKSGVKHYGYMRNFKFINNETMIIKHPKYEYRGTIEFDYQNNQLLGLGQIKYANGSFYEGETLENCENGWGVLKRNDKFIFSGHKKDNKYNGYGEIYYPNGSKFFGWFLNNKRDGPGICMTKEGSCLCNYNDDVKNGGCFIVKKDSYSFELWLYGFIVKTLDKKEIIQNYVKNIYPEHQNFLHCPQLTLVDYLCQHSENN